MGHIQELHAAGIGYLRGVFAGHGEAHIILGQEDVAAGGVILRLMVPHPEDLGSGEACEGGIGGDLYEPFLAHLGGDFLAFCRGALVAPDDGGADHFIILVQHHQAVHLPGEAQAHHIFLVHPAPLHYFADGAGSGFLPIFGVLLCPAVLGLVHGVLGRSLGHGAALFIEEHCLGGGSPHIYADEIFHFRFLPKELSINSS